MRVPGRVSGAQLRLRVPVGLTLSQEHAAFAPARRRLLGVPRGWSLGWGFPFVVFCSLH